MDYIFSKVKESANYNMDTYVPERFQLITKSSLWVDSP